MIAYYPNYITKEKEKQILSIIPDFVKNNTETRNRIFRYGSKLPYDSYMVSDKIPEVFKDLGIENFDSVTINEYDQNQIIEYHIDHKDAGDKIVVLSLLGNAELSFRNPTKDNSLIKSMNIEPLSLYIIEKDYRWIYEHSAKAKELRYSVVFRAYSPINKEKKEIKLFNTDIWVQNVSSFIS